MSKPQYPGVRITTNGNQLVAYHTEARIADGGIFYPITPSTEMGELFQQSYAEGRLNVFGRPTIAIETEGEHAAQGGAIAFSVTGHRTVNFTSGQGIVYGLEQYYHAPGKLSTMVLEVAARALTKHALNVHCGHDDVMAALDTGWIMLFAKDAQQAADQALILRRVTERALTPGMNIQDGFLTSHLERTFRKPEAEFLREFLGASDDIIDCPTEAQRTLFGPTRRRVPRVIDLCNPALIGPVQNQEHYMNGVVARRNNFIEPIAEFLKESYEEFGRLTGRHYGFVSPYKTEGADTIFVSLGCAAENIEAGVDHLRDTRNASVGSVHINVLRPFPSQAVMKSLASAQNIIVLERTDEPLAANNPLTKEIHAAFSQAVQNGTWKATDIPKIFSGVYGLGSRDFRPEAILGAYEYVAVQRARQDGRTAADGETFFTLGIDHPYAVQAEETPSLLPNNAISIRLHSIGGWGMITTGKNLARIMGSLGEMVAERDDRKDENGNLEEVVHISANPKYGSEKKGAPTNYFLVAADERIRVNCDLRHVNVVLCCDPKAFTHTNPLDGLAEGGVFVWESDEEPATAWERIPVAARRIILDRKIRLFILNGFAIARGATSREDLQLRMQGNAFLGAFFRVSSFLDDFGINQEDYRNVVMEQYEKKFGRFGKAVVASNMEVMTQGFTQITEVPHGDIDSPDTSSMRGSPLLPAIAGTCGTGTGSVPKDRAPMQTMEVFDAEFRAGLGYHQPASTLSSVGIVAAATGATASKYVARRETPVFVAENCTQCMACIAACPDTALPNTAQDMGTILRTAVSHYVTDQEQRGIFAAALGGVEERSRVIMKERQKEKPAPRLADIVRNEVESLNSGLTDTSKAEFLTILDKLPLAYSKVNAIFGVPEKKEANSGGIFSIFVSDLCKGCAECVTECGDHEALVMVADGESVNEEITATNAFMDLLPETPKKYLGKYDPEVPQEAKQGALRNHLMQRTNYQALLSGDGACAGCGEKSVLRALASITEAYMRPLFNRKTERILALVARLEAEGVAALKQMAGTDKDSARNIVRSIGQIIMGLGGETDEDTAQRFAAEGGLTDQAVIEALIAVLRQDAWNHSELQTFEGSHTNGMSVMAMAAHTGCNTVYGSTPPNNPHPYPWMNSLFQDGATVGWLFGESFIMDHARRSVLPERIADALLGGASIGDQEVFDWNHMTDAIMTDGEIMELPKVWVIGGDGGMGDIGFQNVSKVVLQNRPNVLLLMLDTQVYSNTGGQNSDSTPMPGGGDMNQMGLATQGKITEKKSLAEIFTLGHGSPFVAQVSMANAAKLYASLLEALTYRGTAFFQCFTTCQPEHGVGDNVSSVQAKRIRDSRGIPEFTFNPSNGETYAEALDLKGNPRTNRDWWETRYVSTKEKYLYTTAHWCATEARFRRHLKPMPENATAIPLDDMLMRITQDDIVNRRFNDESNRAYVPDFGVYIDAEGDDGKIQRLLLSRQMVLFTVERRKAWRILQSNAGIQSADYQAQREFLAKLDTGEHTSEAIA